MDLEEIKGKIKGPAYPIITPFKEDGLIDFDSLNNYTKFLCDSGAKIIYIMAHSSRLGILSLDEVVELNKTVCSFVNKYYSDVITIAATPMYRSTDSCKYVAKQAELSGADLISIIFNERYYFDQQVYNFFSSIANYVSCGILIHEEQLNTIHGTKKINWPLDLLEKVINIDNVIAIKEDAKDDGFTEEIIEKFSKDVAIIVSGGSKEQFIKFGPIGCQSYLVGVGSFDPKVATDFYNFYLNSEFDKCWSIIENIERPFFEVSKTLGWHIGLKSAMELVGLMSKKERPPLIELKELDHDKIRNILIALKYI